MSKHANKMDSFYFTGRNGIKCPQCKKVFYPAPEHSYYAGNAKSKLVCSYRCMREWDKEHLPTAKNTYNKD